MAKSGKKRVKRRRSGKSALIKEIKQLTRSRSQSLLNSVARDIEKLTKTKALNSAQMKGEILKIIAEKEDALKKRSIAAKSGKRKQTKVVSLKIKIARVAKKAQRKKPTRFTDVDPSSTLLAMTSQHDSEKYWYEHGGEKLTGLKSSHSGNLYPANNELRNEMGDQMDDDCGLAPIHQ